MSLPEGPRALVERVDELTRAKIAPPRGALRPRGQEPRGELARSLAGGHSRRGHSHRLRRARARHEHLRGLPPGGGARLRQYRDDRAHALDGHALHRRAGHGIPEAALLLGGRGPRPPLRLLGERARGQPLPHLPDGDRAPPRRRRVRGGRSQALLHHGAGRLLLHGLVRARRRLRHVQGPAPGPRARGDARHPHRRQVGHARDARDLQPVGGVQGRPHCGRCRAR